MCSFLFLKVPNFMWGFVVKTSTEIWKNDPCLKTLKFKVNLKLKTGTIHLLLISENCSQTEWNSLEKLNSTTECTVPRAHYVSPRGTPTTQSLFAIKDFKLGNPFNSYNKAHNEVHFQNEFICITNKSQHKLCPQSFQWKSALLISWVQFGFWGPHRGVGEIKQLQPSSNSLILSVPTARLKS